MDMDSQNIVIFNKYMLSVEEVQREKFMGILGENWLFYCIYSTYLSISCDKQRKISFFLNFSQKGYNVEIAHH